jgi:phosphoribosylformylglycinamidine synthase subunit PurS
MYLKSIALDKLVPKFIVHVVIENKPYINDPEGETIHRDLVLKGGYSNIQSIRSARMLKMIVNSKSRSEAQGTVKKLCEELRIFNPAVSDCTVKAMNRL